MKPSPFSIMTGSARTNISRCQKKSLLLFYRLFHFCFKNIAVITATACMLKVSTLLWL